MVEAELRRKETKAQEQQVVAVASERDAFQSELQQEAAARRQMPSPVPVEVAVQQAVAIESERLAREVELAVETERARLAQEAEKSQQTRDALERSVLLLTSKCRAAETQLAEEREASKAKMARAELREMAPRASADY